MRKTLKIVCPSCDAVHLVLAQPRGGLHPPCRTCGAPLFTGQPIALDCTTRLQKHVISGEVPVLVNFWAPWCGPCRIMLPEFTRSAKMLEPRLRLVTVNTQDAPALAERHKVQAIPTLILFSRGTEVTRHCGTMVSASIVEFALTRPISAELEDQAVEVA